MGNLLKRYRTEIAVALVGGIAINAILLAQAFRSGDAITTEGAGQLGDFVGGYVGTFLVLFSVVLLYRTLRSQQTATDRQQFLEKYFELIKMHRENVAELRLQDAAGRKIFVLLIREFRAMLRITREVAAAHQQSLHQIELLQIAYNCLFYGTGPNSTRMLRMSISHLSAPFARALEARFQDSDLKRQTQIDLRIDYVPFEGHQSRLGHYYRHLYQTVSFVNDSSLDLNKYDLARTVRAQLSTHEQAMLLLNSLSPLGWNWWRKRLITEFRLVKNIPEHFFESASELDISLLFAPDYFEWSETSQGLPRELAEILPATRQIPKADSVANEILKDLQPRSAGGQ